MGHFDSGVEELDTEIASLSYLFKLEEQEQSGLVNYQKLFDRLAGLYEKSMIEPKSLSTHHHSELISLERFFGIHPYFKQNYWRLKNVGKKTILTVY